jgi:parallel beta-helix repeat protein
LHLPKLLAVVGTVVVFLVLASSAAASGVRCGDAIATNTRLEADLVGCPADGIVIAADHVTLDLNGHRISGHGAGAGVLASGRVGVEVKHGAIEGFAEGVGLRSTTASSVRQVALVGNGISCTDSSGCAIEQNTLSGGAAILVAEAPGATRSSIAGNLVRGAPGPGIEVRSTPNGARIVKNVVEQSGIGLAITRSSATEIVDNTLRSNAGDGIFVSVGDLTLIERNLLARNGGNGIELDRIADAAVLANVVTRNAANGIRAKGLPRPLVQDNVASRNGLNGLLVGGGPNRELTTLAQLVRNVAVGNARHGITLTRSARGSYREGNRVAGNGAVR